jgi:cytoskeleton protein RodZ
MTSIGDTLRRERLRRGLQLEQVAAETKIGTHLLEAMEANQFDRLPGGVFTRSFLRQYAHNLGLDEEEIIKSLKEQFEQPEPSPAPPPKPSLPNLSQMPSFEDVVDRLRSDSSMGALVWVVVVALVCAGMYKLWQRAPGVNSGNRTAVPLLQPGHEPAFQQPAQAKPTEPPPDVSKQGFRPAEVSGNGTITVPPVATSPVAAPPTAETPSAARVSASQQPAPREAAGAVRVAFTATEPVWVSVKSDGARAYSGTIDSQQSKQFDAVRKMIVLVGNAGAIKISLNGKPLGPFGAQGETRLLMLTPEGARVIHRASPNSPLTPGDSTAPAPEGERR